MEEMQIRTNIQDRYTEMELHVCKDVMDDEVRRLVAELHAMYDPTLTGTDEVGNRVVITPGEIVTFYAEKQKVYALGYEKKYSLAKTLAELERELASYGFFRISKSELVNLRKVKNLDLGVTGTIRVVMRNGYETYTSRRNVAKLKELLLRDRDRATGQGAGPEARAEQETGTTDRGIREAEPSDTEKKGETGV